MLKRRLSPWVLVAALGAAFVVSGIALARSVDLAESVLTPEPGGSRDIPETVWFQGFLADPVTADPISGSHDIEANIYDDPTTGALVWGPEYHLATEVVEGWFNIELGLSETLPEFDDPPYYLDLTIDGETLDPRLKIASVPTALRAGRPDLLWPRYDIVNSSDAGIGIAQTGTGTCAWFEQDNPGGDAALYSRATNAGPGVFARNMGSGPGLKAQADGPGPAVFALANGGGPGGVFQGDVEVEGALVATSTDTFAGDFYSPADRAIVLRSRYTGPDGQDATGILAQATPDDAWGFGGVFDGSFMGVYGNVEPLPVNGGGIGVAGECSGGTGASVNTGVYGYASGGTENYGVVGDVGGGASPESWAGYFYGDVYAEGYAGPVARMEIDHPVNPAGETLTHAYVASDDMKTVYDGVLVLDGSGSAWVDLPDWFEALNGEFRYQLTPIGAAAPNLHIASPIAGNRFAIGGGEPGLEVCWQVTGIRHDAVAEMRREPVVSAKLGDKRGKYLHPEAFGLPESMAADRSEERERGKALLRERLGGKE